MPATTPYEQNDYTAVSSYRPYRLPINDIFKANAAIDSFWDAGALKVDKVYEDALGMSLTLNQNKEVRDKYMQDAEKQIVKLSSMNLADPSVQRQGFGIFKPVLSDKSILIDNHLTKLRTSIIGNAESYKTKKLSKNGKDGEGYNVDNLRDALDGFQDFNANTLRDEDKLTELYGKLQGKEYVPYYDYNKDMINIMKECKGASTSSASTLGNYIQTNSQSGATDAVLAECLTYSLNDQAKTQLGIEGRQAFKNGDGTINYRALADTYTSRFTRESEGLKTQGEKISGRIVALKQEYGKTGNKDLKDEIDFQESLLEKNVGRHKNLIEGYNKIKLGDKDFLDKNYDDLSSQIYFNSKVDGFAVAFQTPTVKSTLDEDANKMQKDRLLATEIENEKKRIADIAMENLNFEHEKTIEAIRQGKKVDKNGKVIEDLVAIDPTSIEADKTKRGMQDFMSELETTQKQAIAITTGFFNGNVKGDWLRNGGTKETFMDPATGQLTTAAKQYLKDKKLMDSEEVNKYLEQMAPLNAKTVIARTVMDIVEKDTGVAALSAEFRKKISNKSDYPDVVYNGVRISAIDIQNAIEGKQSPLKIVTSTEDNLSPFTGEGRRSGQSISHSYLVNGKLIHPNSPEGRDLEQKIIVITKGNKDKNDQITKRKNELFGQAFLAKQGRVYGEAENNNSNSMARSTFLTVANRVGGAKLEMSDVRITSYSPLDGMTTATITLNKDKAKLPDEKALIAGLQGLTKTDKTIQNVSIGDNSITVDFISPYLVDKEIASNPMIAVQYSLGSLEQILKVSNHTEVGERMTNSEIVIPDPRDNKSSYKVIPYKDPSTGQISWELQTEWKSATTPTRVKGEYYKITDGLTKDQIISKINTR